MAHLAISLGDIGIELEDEDEGIKALVKIGEGVLTRVVTLITPAEAEVE